MNWTARSCRAALPRWLLSEVSGLINELVYKCRFDWWRRVLFHGAGNWAMLQGDGARRQGWKHPPLCKLIACSGGLGVPLRGVTVTVFLLSAQPPRKGHWVSWGAIEPSRWCPSPRSAPVSSLPGAVVAPALLGRARHPERVHTAGHLSSPAPLSPCSWRASATFLPVHSRGSRFISF